VAIQGVDHQLERKLPDSAAKLKLSRSLECHHPPVWVVRGPNGIWARYASRSPRSQSWHADPSLSKSSQSRRNLHEEAAGLKVRLMPWGAFLRGRARAHKARLSHQSDIAALRAVSRIA